MTWLMTVNNGAVGLFGAVLSAAFSSVPWSARERRAYLGMMLLLGGLQAVLFMTVGGPVIRELYPLITHLPLVLLLWYLSRRLLWSTVSVFMAYLCCQLRRWVGLLVVGLFGGGDLVQAAVELAVTVPMAVLLIRFAAPSVRSMSQRPFAVQLQFGVIPAVSYAFDYLTRVYTDWLVQGVPAAVEFMPFVCAVAYLAFTLYSSETLRRQNELEQTRAVLDLQVKQAVEHIDSMKRTQAQAAAYRHDLRHHLQYLSSCLEQGDVPGAQAYICSLSDSVKAQTMTQYCENTAMNLILSSFASRAAEADVTMTVRVRLGEFVRVANSDLCVLLSNALENALYACGRARNAGLEAEIRVLAYEKDGRAFLEIANTCPEPVAFDGGLPVTREKGHGLGARSIQAVAERCGGLCSFEQTEGEFLLRVVL